MKVWGTYCKATKTGLIAEDFEEEIKKESLVKMKREVGEILRKKDPKEFRSIRQFYYDKTETLETKETVEKREEFESKEDFKKEILEEVKKSIDIEIKNILKDREFIRDIKNIIKEEVNIYKTSLKPVKKVKEEKVKKEIKIDIKKSETKDDKVESKVASGLKKAKALLNFKK